MDFAFHHTICRCADFSRITKQGDRVFEQCGGRVLVVEKRGVRAAVHDIKHSINLIFN